MVSKYDNLKEDIIVDYYENNLTIEEIYKKYNIKSRAYVYTFLKERRDYSERSKLAHQQHPDSFKHSEETKEKIRRKRLQYMKDHPEDTAWRKKNSPSYPEQVFIKFLKEKEYDKHYYIERECPVFPYYIDFAFVNEKVAVEIDGSQHLDEERSKKDKEKDELLKSQGWCIIRISEDVVKTDWDIIDAKLKSVLKDKVIMYEQIGILKHTKLPSKVERDEYGRSKKITTNSIKNRKVERPDKEELYKLLIEEKNFTRIANRFNVSSNAIKKWCKWYKLPTSIKYYKTMDNSRTQRIPV